MPAIDQIGPLVALEDWLMEEAGYSHEQAEAIVAFTAAEGTVTGAPYLDPEDEECATAVYLEAMADLDDDDPAWGPRSPEIPVRSVLSMLLGGSIVPPELEQTEEEQVDEWLDPEEDEITLTPTADPDHDPHDGESFDRAMPLTLDVEPFHSGFALPPISGGSPGGFRRIRTAAANRREEEVGEPEVRARLAEAFGEDSVDRLLRSMVDDGRSISTRDALYFYDPLDGPIVSHMPPISGGSPEAGRVDAMREWYRRNPIERFNRERTD